VRSAVLSDDLVQEVAALFKVLAHPTRIRILRALAQVELCVCDLAVVLGMTVSAVSHQLRAMRASQLVRYRTQGKLVYYAVREPFILELLDRGLLHLQGEELA
jgi:DNA-binding transcriptional ArsR family regulator